MAHVVEDRPLRAGGDQRLLDALDPDAGPAASSALVAEKRLNSASFGLSTDDNEAYCTAGWNGDWEVYRSGSAQPAPDVNEPGETNPHNAFGSAHPTGFNVLFCDGSVRYLRYSMSPHTWIHACVRNDNEAFNQNDL